ncbi:MAG: protoheme IX farnesyltransferase [Pirellulales bacterium]|nr:protoheme IX farnesyltransferase [Pirellulales bacterium]
MRHYWQLIRPGVLAGVLFSTMVAALTAGPRVPPWPLLAHLLLGTGVLMAGAAAMNQLLEHRSDAKMVRTAGRPLPRQTLTARQVTAFAVVSSVAAAVYLATLTTMPVALMAVLSWAVYVLIYTPLKRVTCWQTPVGAVGGATPVLLGAAAAGAVLSPMSLVLFGLVLLWQFPHTMAIAWIYRRQYAAGGVRVATVVDPTGRLAGRLALLGAGSLLPVSLIPPVLGWVGWTFGVVAMLLGLAHLTAAARFSRHPEEGSALVLRRVSAMHLPVLLTALLLAVRC